MKVKIENYQSIADTEFEVKGFTALTGPTNTGKSAALNAVASTFFHRLGNDFVRSGASKAQVTVVVCGTDGEDHEIIWTKGKSVNQFIVDGETYASVGKSAPEVLETFGIRDPMTNSGQVRILHSHQHDQPFLLFDPAQAISVVMASSRVTVVQKAASLADSEERSVNSELRVRQKDVAGVEEEVNTLSGFRVLDEAGKQAKKAAEFISGLEKEVAKLGALREEFTRLKEEGERFAAVEKALRVPFVSMGRRVEKQASELRILEDTSRKHAELTQVITRLEKIQDAPVRLIDAFSKKASLVKAGMTYLRLQGEALAYTAIIDLCQVPPTITRLAEATVAARENLQAMEAVEKTGGQLEKAQEEFRNLLDEIGKCPTCGGEIDGSKLEEVCHA